MPIGYDGRPKQDEYNKAVRTCDLFVALFRTKAGQYTLEEFEVAKKAQMEGSKPTLYIFCRELKADEHEEPELTRFKADLFNDLRHYWSKYDSSDSLQLKFVLELLRVENRHMEELKVEDGKVVLNGLPVASMDNLRFAAGNPDYQKQQQRLAELPGEIEKMRKKLERHPDDEDYLDDLQKLLNERNKLQEDFQQHQQFLFDTAKRIAQLQGEQITERMQRAMDAFEAGDAHGANIILDEAQRDAKRHFADYKQSKEITEQKRQNVIKSIEELRLKTSTVMADGSIDIEERIVQVMELYRQADEMARWVAYDKKEYAEMLSDYSVFLYDYGHYKESEEFLLRQILLVEKLYGKEHQETADLYVNIGSVYYRLGTYHKALDYLFRALDIEIHSKTQADTFATYNVIGLVYESMGDYPKALEYLSMALEAEEKVCEKSQKDAAITCNNMGTVYDDMGDYSNALRYYCKALEMNLKKFGEEHFSVATAYCNIGLVYGHIGNYSKSLECLFKALEIDKIVLGVNHPDTATTYNNIGLVFATCGNEREALNCYFQALKIREIVFGVEHPDTANSYGNIGMTYLNQRNYDKALGYLFKGLDIEEKIYGKNHPDVAKSYHNVGYVYYELKNYPKALEFYTKALKIREKILGKEHPDTSSSYNNIGCVFHRLKNYFKAQEYYIKSLEISEKTFGTEHPDTACLYHNIGQVFQCLGNNLKAEEYFAKAYYIYRKNFGENHQNTILSRESLLEVKAAMAEESTGAAVKK